MGSAPLPLLWTADRTGLERSIRVGTRWVCAEVRTASTPSFDG